MGLVSLLSTICERKEKKRNIYIRKPELLGFPKIEGRKVIKDPVGFILMGVVSRFIGFSLAHRSCRSSIQVHPERLHLTQSRSSSGWGMNA